MKDYAIKTRRATANESLSIDKQITRQKRRAAVKRVMGDIFAGLIWAVVIAAPFYFYLMEA